MVHAVLLYRSTCNHCQQLMAEILPPIRHKYGNQLVIFYCDVSKPEGDAIFTAAITSLHIKTIGVPTIIIGEEVLIGNNISIKFSKIIDAAISHGGLDWPDIPGLKDALQTTSSTTLPTPAYSGYPSDALPGFPSTPVVGKALPADSSGPNPSQASHDLAWMANNFNQDPIANTLSVIVLAAMIMSVIVGMRNFLVKPGAPLSKTTDWILPGLCILGCVIASYLAFVEMTTTEAICGPVGNCQSVQNSGYAQLFGILPIGLLGLAGYLAIFLSWLASFHSRMKNSAWPGLLRLGIAFAGTMFSIYLTFLEPFIIGASCLWCLSSAAIMTVLMLLNISSGKLAFDHVRQNGSFGSAPG